MSSNVINVVGDNTTICINSMEEKASLPRTGCIKNWYNLQFDYYPRDKINKKIQSIQKGKVLILHGAIGTGKSSAVLHFISNASDRFTISWRVDFSKNEEGIFSDLSNLADKLNVKTDNSFSQLFHVIKERAEKENIIFFLDNLQKKPSSTWFKELWQIKDFLYIIVTTNNATLSYPAADKIPVDTFDEAVAFLKEDEKLMNENNDDDLRELCNYFSWNALGLTAAKLYITTSTNGSVQFYLEMMRDKEVASVVRKAEKGTLYEAVRICLEEIDRDRFPAVAIISLIAHESIPEFLLSNVFSSNNALMRRAYLNDLQGSLLLKSLIYVTKENDVQFFSFHKFTQSVVHDLLAEDLPWMPKKKELIDKMAGILVKYFNKDKPYTRNNFMLRILANHAKEFLNHCTPCNVEETDDRILISIIRLSELVGFAHTQLKQPVAEQSLNTPFQRAETMLHQFCGITNDDLIPAKSCQESDNSSSPLGIVSADFSTAQHLFEKLSQKSSQLPIEVVREIAFLRILRSSDLSLYPENIRNNENLKKKVESFEPLSTNDVDLLVSNGFAYAIDDYRKLFLAELYVSLLYSFGRNLFYVRKQSIQEPISFYINRLKLAYCLSCEISKRMKPGEGVLHEYLAQSNALLYLLVNDDETSEETGGLKLKPKEKHCRDLKNAIKCYHMLIENEMQFFEMGILKKTKDDRYSQLVCHNQIVRCYIALMSPEIPTTNEQRDEHVRDGLKHCEDLLKCLYAHTTKDVDGKVTSELEHFAKFLNVVGEFYLATNCDDYFMVRAWRMFITAAQEAEVMEDAPIRFYLQALVGLADVFSRLGEKCFVATQISNRQLKHCEKENFHQIRHQQPRFDEIILGIKKRNTTTIVNHYAQLWLKGGAASSQPVAGLGLRTVDTVTVDKREDSSGHEEQGNDRDVPEIVNSAQAFSGALPMDSFLGVSEAPKSVPLVCSTLKNDQDQRSTHEDENSEGTCAYVDVILHSG